MNNRERMEIRKRVISASGHRSLRRSARRASFNAQRISRGLDIPYTVIKGGIIYTVYNDKWTETRRIDKKKVSSNTIRLRKGDKIFL